jgi:hypothetical protein
LVTSYSIGLSRQMPACHLRPRLARPAPGSRGASRYQNNTINAETVGVLSQVNRGFQVERERISEAAMLQKDEAL